MSFTRNDLKYNLRHFELFLEYLVVVSMVNWESILWFGLFKLYSALLSAGSAFAVIEFPFLHFALRFWNQT